MVFVLTVELQRQCKAAQKLFSRASPLHNHSLVCLLSIVSSGLQSQKSRIICLTAQQKLCIIIHVCYHICKRQLNRQPKSMEPDNANNTSSKYKQERGGGTNLNIYNIGKIQMGEQISHEFKTDDRFVVVNIWIYGHCEALPSSTVFISKH